MNNDKNNHRASWWQPGLMLFFRLSGWIVGPIILAIFIGKWLDRKYNTEPWLFLLSVGIAFALSIFGIIKDSLGEIKKIEEQVKKEKEERENEDK